MFFFLISWLCISSCPHHLAPSHILLICTCAPSSHDLYETSVLFMYVHTGPASQQPLRLSSDGPHASLPAAPLAVGLLTWVDYDFMYYVPPFAFMPCTVDVYLQASPSFSGLAEPLSLYTRCAPYLHLYLHLRLHLTCIILRPCNATIRCIETNCDDSMGQRV